MTRRAVVVLVVLGALAPVAHAQIIPTFRKDLATDGRGALDVVRVAISRGAVSYTHLTLPTILLV